MSKHRFRIRPNQNVEVPRHHVCFDTETTQVNIDPQGSRIRHILKLGTAVYFRFDAGTRSGEQWFSFTSETDFQRWLLERLRPKTKIWVWCHNAAFDWSVCRIWDLFESDSFRPSMVSLGSGCTFVNTASPEGNATFIDSLNWFRCSIADIGESLRLPKLGIPVLQTDYAAWEAYCHRDVEILMEAVTRLFRFVRDNDLGSFRLTAASQAMQAYRHKFGEKYTYNVDKETEPGKWERVKETGVFPIVHSSGDVLRLERRAYTQGAVRAFRLGKIDGPVYVLDVKSAYPQAMYTHWFPCRLKSLSVAGGWWTKWTADELKCSIADCEINTLEPIFPLRVGNNIVYPVGTFWTTLAGPELHYAAALGALREISVMASYDMMPLFRSYVSALYGLRVSSEQSGNHVQANLCKTILNSLSGKFGQLQHQWERDDTVESPNEWGQFRVVNAKTGKVTNYRAIAGYVERENIRHVHSYLDYEGKVVSDTGGDMSRDEHPNSFPAIPAFINAYARCKIWRLIDKAKQAGEVYYSAVDSIHCNKQAYLALAGSGDINDGLGGLRLVTVAKQAEYRGLSNYSLDGSLHIAGVSKTAECQPDGSLRYTYWPSGNDLLSNGKPNDYTTTVQRRKSQPAYIHGRVDGNGNTFPWVLPLEREEMLTCLSHEKYRQSGGT